MFFPIVIHKDPETCYGVTIPDIPGCFTAGKTLEEAIHNVQEAVECHLSEATEPPCPSPPERHLADPLYSGGTWFLVDIDFSFLETTPRQIKITLPQSILRRIDALARQRRLSRSAFLLEVAQRALAADEG